MATVTPTLLEIQNAVARWLYQLANYAGLSAQQKLQTDEIIQRGYRLYMTPPILPGEKSAHVWSWIHPNTTLAVAADPSGTTTTVVAEDTALIDSAATFTTGWDVVASSELIGKTVTLTIGTTTYTNTIASVTNATTLVMDNAWSAAAAAAATTADTYTITSDGDRNLPADHGGVVGKLTFDTTTVYPPVIQTSVARIMGFRQTSVIDQTERPRYFAVRIQPHTLGTSEQRMELMLWPRPDAAFTLHYRYIVLHADVTDATYFFPGGQRNVECLLASCLAIAERFADPTTPVSGRQWEYFIETLRTCISTDRSDTTADNLGPMIDRSDDRNQARYQDFSTAVTYLGVTYPT